MAAVLTMKRPMSSPKPAQSRYDISILEKALDGVPIPARLC
jgi:hypothetical protein